MERCIHAGENTSTARGQNCVQNCAYIKDPLLVVGVLVDAVIRIMQYCFRVRCSSNFPRSVEEIRSSTQLVEPSIMSDIMWNNLTFLILVAVLLHGIFVFPGENVGVYPLVTSLLISTATIIRELRRRGEHAGEGLRGRDAPGRNFQENRVRNEERLPTPATRPRESPSETKRALSDSKAKQPLERQQEPLETPPEPLEARREPSDLLLEGREERHTPSTTIAAPYRQFPVTESWCINRNRRAS